jgi:RecJ-like exonuclease
MIKIFFLLIAVLIVLTGCSGEQYGAGISKDAPTVTVKDVLLTPSLLGQTVTIEGTIISQCTSRGCWFFIQDKTGQIFINLEPKGFSIPPRIGKAAKVTGVVSGSPNGVQIVADSVEIE